MLLEDFVGFFAHHCNKFHAIRNIHRHCAIVGIWIARAIPIEICTAVAPCKAFIFADDSDVNFSFAEFSSFKTSAKRKLPTNIRLRFYKVHTFFLCKMVKDATKISGKTWS